MPPDFSFMIAVRQPPANDGRTHASSVIAVLRSSEVASGMFTRALEPSKSNAPPKRPSVHWAPDSVPLLAFPELSTAVVPVPSSKPQAPTRPVGSTAGLVTVTATGAVVGRLPAASRAIAVIVWGPLSPNVLQECGYGAEVSSEPKAAPSPWTWAPSTPTLSAAFAVSVTAPDTVAPLAGAVTLTVGGWLSGGGAAPVVNVQATGAASAVPSAAVTPVPRRAVYVVE